MFADSFVVMATLNVNVTIEIWTVVLFVVTSELKTKIKWMQNIGDEYCACTL